MNAAPIPLASRFSRNAVSTAGSWSGKRQARLGCAKSWSGVGADLDGAVDGALDAASAMAADQHPA